MKQLTILFCSGLMLVISFFAGPGARVEADLAAAGEIVLVAGDVVDLRWDPSQYPNPNNEPLIRWELYRQEPGGFKLVTSGTGTNKDGHRDKNVPLGIVVYYYLDVIRDGGGEQKIYRAFTTQMATTGRIWGTVLDDLELGAGSFEVVGTVVISSGVTLAITSHTTLSGPLANVPARLHATGGILQVDGGTFENNLRLQYGSQDLGKTEGHGWVHNGVFHADSPNYRPAVEIYTHSDQHFDLVGNQDLTLEGRCFEGAASLRIQDNKGTSTVTTGRNPYLDCALDAEIKNNEDVTVILDSTTATIEQNPLVTVRLSNAASAGISKNAFVREVTANLDRDDPDAYLRTKVVIEKNPKVGWITLYDRADASIVSNELVEGPIEIRAASTVTIQDNTISGRIWVTGYGTPKAVKAKATITGNTISFPYKNLGVHVYDGAKAEVVGNIIEWTGFHGSEASVLLAAAGEGTELLADGNTLLGGKLFVYDKVKVNATWNVIKGRAGYKGGAITIGCLVCLGDVEGAVNHNTVQDAWGFEVWDQSPRLQIQHNCIRGNDPGLTTDDYSMSRPVDMRQNWWGDKSGPYHPAQNPGGSGDRIDGKQVLFKPWDETGASCHDTPPSAQLPDLSLAGIEVVQVVQTLQNDVPLVARKPAVVRVYPRSNVPVSGVTAQLKVYRDGKLLATLEPDPANVSDVWLTDPAKQRANSKKSLNFNLNAAWVRAGSLTLRAELNPLRSPVERDYSNNVITKTVTFQERRPLNILYVPIDYQPPGTPHEAPSHAAIIKAHTYLQNIYPHAQIEYSITNDLLWDKKMIGFPVWGAREHARILFKTLEDKLTFWNAQPGTKVPFDQAVGVFPEQILGACVSTPRSHKINISGQDREYKGRGLVAVCHASGGMFAHEIGHNLGLQHPDTPDAIFFPIPLPKPVKVPPNYWSANGYKNATIQEYGWDFRPLQQTPWSTAAVPNTTYDLMSYHAPKWISPLHYRMLFEANGAPQPWHRSSSAQTYLLVSGEITAAGAVSFDPFWQVTTDRPPVNPPQGSGYCVDLLGAGGATLASRCFDLGFIIPDGFIDTGVEGFNLALLLPADTARVVLRQDAGELGGVAVTASAPTVRLLQPNGGGTYDDSVAVSWTGADPDGDELAYNLYYSHDDGASWRPAVLNISGATSIDLDLSAIPGGEKARLRVEASDGFHIAGDQSDGSFEVADHAPAVGIDIPEDNGAAILPLSLIGYAYDPEEGQLEDASLAWSSDVEGPLGTGGFLEIGQITLGQHVLTLTATDSKGNQNSDRVTVMVKDLRVFLPDIFAR